MLTRPKKLPSSPAHIGRDASGEQVTLRLEIRAGMLKEGSHSSLSTAEKNALDFEVLSDVKGEAGRAYRLTFDFSQELETSLPRRGQRSL